VNHISTTALKAGTPAIETGRTGARSSDFGLLRLRLYALLFAVDAAAMAASFLVANQLRYGRLTESFGLNTFLLLFPLYVALGFNRGAWSIEALSSPRRSAALAVKSLLFAIALAAILLFSLKMGADFSRLVFGIGATMTVLAVALGRLVIGRQIGERNGWSFRKEVLLIDQVDTSPVGRQLVIDAQALGIDPALDDPLMLDRFARALDSCERVIVSCPVERRGAWSRMLAGANVDAEMLVPELDAVGALGLRRHGAHNTLLVGCGPLRMQDRITKRLFDIAFSAALLVILLPAIAAIALAIRLESPGPILFRQERLGRANRLFRILKFRSMRFEAADHSGARSASRDDDRITRVGGFLRRTSLDELPQLLNVLAGEMSVVGPRPHPLGCRADDELFWNIDERYFDRHSIKPGITGLAQVRGFRGATEKRSDVTDRLRADLEYLDGWHIGRDAAIIARTAAVLIHPNAF
jgi:lipopolysaccharide/colanic/teichoic acid biosynthesis glycosyltransferase